MARRTGQEEPAIRANVPDPVASPVPVGTELAGTMARPAEHLVAHRRPPDAPGADRCVDHLVGQYEQPRGAREEATGKVRRDAEGVDVDLRVIGQQGRLLDLRRAQNWASSTIK